MSALARWKKSRIVLPALIMALLYWLSSLPGTPTPHDPAIYSLFYWISPFAQNMLHIPAYAALGSAWWWALRDAVRLRNVATIAAGVLGVAYGALDEWHQSFVPGRYASLTDLMLDVVGIAVGLWIAVRLGRDAGSR